MDAGRLQSFGQHPRTVRLDGKLSAQRHQARRRQR